MTYSKIVIGITALFTFIASFTTSAEDIDLFSEISTVTGSRPNVLLVLDNAASNNSNITLLNGSTGNKLEMLRQVLNNIVDPLNSTFFPSCVVSGESRTPVGCVTRQEVDDLLKGINLGLMIANPSGNGRGGYVRSHIRPMDIASNRTALLSKINPAIPQANNAPYAKSMHEAYLYYGGKAAYVGFDSNLYDPEAKNGSIYRSPATEANICADNYIIFVGNGGPDSGENNDARSLLNGIGGVLATDPVQFTPNNETTSWFDEYARTLKKQDVVPALAGIQNVTTYTIAVQNPADNNFNTNPVRSSRELLRSAATLGGGEYYLASDGQKAMAAFINALRKMQPVNTVFAAVTLPVSVNVRGTFLNQVYMGQFRPDDGAKPRWPGNLKLYQIALDVNENAILADRNGQGVEDTVNGFLLPDKTSFWTTPSTYWSFDPMGNPLSSSDAPDGAIVEKGGRAQRLRQGYATNPTSRNLYTCNGSCTTGSLLSSTPFNTTNTGLGADLVNWVRGADNKDNEDGNNISTDIRARIHGDLLHSRPAVVNYNRTSGDRDIMVYYGANDGVFHAVKGGTDDADGVEKWGMIFPEFFGRLNRLRENDPQISPSARKPYFADGPVSVYQKDANSDGKIVASDGDKVYLYIGMRRGGRFMYALDVSNTDGPKYLWKIDNSGSFAELGQTWSAPRAAKINAVPNDPVVIFGAGYDPENEDTLPAGTNNKGRGIFVVNARTGALVKHIYHADMGSMPADVTVVDRDNNGLYDRIYAVDTKGNLWRSDINNADSSAWQIYKIATLADTGVNARKFLNKPDVVPGQTYDSILIGSGDRENPFDTTVINRFYMVKDPNVGLTGGLPCLQDGTPAACAETDLVDVTLNPHQDTPLPSGKMGWYITLAAGEKVVGNPLTVLGTTFFGTNKPTPPASGVCTSNLGEARLYSVGFETGNATRDLNADDSLTDNDRSQVIPGGGYLPSPVYAPVSIDLGDGTVQTVDAICVGTHCFNADPSGFNTNRTRTYWRLEQ